MTTDNSIRPFPSLVLLVMGLLLLTGCSETREIQTAPPQPGPSADQDAPADRSLLTVVLETGPTHLPRAIQSIRFRADTLRLKRAGGPWVSHPLAAGPLTITDERRPRRELWQGVVTAARYDSAAVSLQDVFVEFGPNAGAPLQVRRPASVPAALTLEPGEPAEMHLQFEPGLSLLQRAGCEWYFRPVFRTGPTQ